MAFPDSFVEDVRRVADIVKLVGEYVALRKMGTSWKGLCPFHQEKSPSFNVRADPAMFHCFGCGEGGDVFKFVMLKERVSFPESVEIVARRFGVPVPAARFEVGAERQEREGLFALMEAATQHFSRLLWTPQGTRAREYLQGRGFQRSTLERIRAGASPDGWDGLLKALGGQFPPDKLQLAGLVLQGQRGLYDRFRGRAMFPILNDQGRAVAFGARSLDGSEPKYLNSPETPVYRKGGVLYGFSWAKEPIQKAGHAVLMEGYLDVARALEHGVSEVVATCGTALTAGQAKLLRRFTSKVLVNFDQDAAGLKAAERSFEVLVAEGLEVQVVELPQGDDPDTFIRAQGADAYRERLAKARPYMDWRIGRAAAEHDTATPIGKAAYLSALLPSLLQIGSAVERAAWVPRIVERGRLDPRATSEELRKALASHASSVPVRPPAEVVPLRPRSATSLLVAEKALLVMLLRGSEGVAAAVAGLEDADLAGLHGEGLLKAARSLACGGRAPSPGALQEALTAEADRRLVSELALEEPATQTSPGECVRVLKRRPLEARLSQIQSELGRAPDDAALNALLSEKTELKRLIASL